MNSIYSSQSDSGQKKVEKNYNLSEKMKHVLGKDFYSHISFVGIKTIQISNIC